MAQVELFKKSGTYMSKEGKERNFTNFYVKCGDSYIPVQVSFFDDGEGHDPQYSGRRMVMSSYADVMPDKPKPAEESKKN